MVSTFFMYIFECTYFLACIINNDMDNHIDKIKAILIDLYNSAYSSYLSALDPVIFFHTFTNCLIKVLNAQCGAIMFYDKQTDTSEIITHASNYPSNVCTNSMWSILSKYIRSNSKFGEDSVLTKCLKCFTVQIETDCSVLDILGSSYSNSNLDLSTIQRKTIVFVQCLMDSQVVGLISLCFDRYFDELEQISMIECTSIIQDMMGVLMYNVRNKPLHLISDANTNVSINNSVTFQLINDALDAVSDCIVITDIEMRIIYTNNNFTNLIKSKYEREMSEYLFDILSQTISLLGSQNKLKHTGFYTNKKLDVDDLDVCVNSTMSCGDVYHIFCIKEDHLHQTNKITKQSKNLIAYLSHELRNPIQAISTGVFLIDRTLKSININLGLTNETDSNKTDSDKSKSSNLLRRSYIDTDENDFCDGTTSTSYNDQDLDFDNDMFRTSSVNSLNLSVIELTESNTPDEFSDAKITDSIISYDSDSSGISNLEYVSSNTSNITNTSRKNLAHEGLENEIFQVNNLLNTMINTKVNSKLNTVRNVIKRVSSACKNMNIIIDDILDLSKIDNNEFIMNFDEHSLHEIIEMIVDESISESNKKGIEFVYDFDKLLPDTLYTDGTRVFQILSNLVSNAIKYSNTGEINFRVKYDTEFNSVIFQVIDQGIGIRKEEFANLFKQFGRTSNSVTEINSTGLGLCVCQKIANLLGGSIEVTSEYKKGSMFTFTHPIKLGYSSVQNTELDFQSNTETSVQKEIKGNVLIVDDDPNITSLFKLLLRWLNYDKGYELNIETANSGEKTLMLIKSKHYKLIFMDIDLDGEDGCMISNEIRSVNADVHIVAVTANIKSVQKDRDESFNVFDDVILKPFNNKKINDCVVKYLT